MIEVSGKNRHKKLQDIIKVDLSYFWQVAPTHKPAPAPNWAGQPRKEEDALPPHYHQHS